MPRMTKAEENIAMKLLRRFTGSRKVNRSLGGNIALMSFLLLISLFMALPVIYVLTSAFKPLNELFLWPPPLFPRHPTLDNFVTMYQIIQNSLVPATRYIFNSVFVAGVGTSVYILIASMCAYPLAKHTFKLKAPYISLLVWALLFRPEVMSMPQYIIISTLKMADTYFALILPALSGTLGVFMMLQFMSTVPDVMLEAAKIDGASEFRVYWEIVMPQVRPAWLTLLIFTFQGFWSASGVGINYIYSETMKMLPSLLSQITSAGFARAGAGATVALIMLIPPVAVYLYCQASVVETMSHVGIK
jgi:putative chitobiose transport system permease protein